jgi:hypothetical protein
MLNLWRSKQTPPQTPLPTVNFPPPADTILRNSHLHHAELVEVRDGRRQRGVDAAGRRHAAGGQRALHLLGAEQPQDGLLGALQQLDVEADPGFDGSAVGGGCVS